MAQEGRSTLTEPRPISSRPVAEAQALIEEARRRHRRRQALMAVAAVTVVAVGLVLAVTLGGSGGSASHGLPSAPGGTVARRAPPPVGPASSEGAVTIGRGPTAIDFVSADRGWMATGCSSYCYESNPLIIGTDDGGRIWHTVHPPDMAATSVAGSVWYQYGGVVEVRFVSPARGWYLQAGELWATSDGGRQWRLVSLGGVVSTMATSAGNVWAVVDSCPNGALLACGPFHLYVESNAARGWHRVTNVLFPGGGQSSNPALVAEGDTAQLSYSGRTVSATPGGALVPVDPSCRPVGPLTSRLLVGLCGIGGGGDASAVSFAVSTDHGRTWRHFVGGPPSDGWSGTTATNGQGAVFYVTGGTTLWRVDTADRTWEPVLRTPADTTDELYPVYFASGSLGFVGESGSSGVVLFVTHDGGLSWNAMPPP
jgi:hypothetical protein